MLAATAAVAIVVPIVVGTLSGPRLRAQASSTPGAPDDSLGPPFATFSIEANSTDGLKSYPWVNERGRFAAKNVSLRSVITYAYQIKDGRISGGPQWTFGRDADRFDIEAEADGNSSKEQVRAMVRRLLADKFNLIAHRETREQPIYGLVLAHGDGALGPQLRASACSGKTPPPPGPYDPARPIALPCGSARAIRGALEARWVTIDELADFLSLNVGRAVRNRTGLDGHFDLDASWTPDTRPPGPQSIGVGPATFVALEEQLGLRLTEETGPVEVLVIDRMERPAQP